MQEALVAFEECVMLDSTNDEPKSALLAARSAYIRPPYLSSLLTKKMRNYIILYYIIHMLFCVLENFFAPLVAGKPIAVKTISLELGRGVFAAKRFVCLISSFCDIYIYNSLL